MKAGWRLKLLSEVCDRKPSKAEARRRLVDTDNVSFVPMNELGIHQKYFEALETRPLSAVVGSYTYFADSDVLLAKITPCFENGKLGIAQGLENGIGFGSSEFMVLRPKPELSSEYLYYFLDQEPFREMGAKAMTGAVGHKRIPPEFVEALQIPLPPIDEQRRIVAVLDKALAGIATASANTQKNLTNVPALFENYAHTTFAKLAETEIAVSLKGLTELITKGSSPKWQGITYVDKPGVLFVTSENVGSYELKLDKPKYVELEFNKKNRKSILQNGDVLTNIVGASIGRTAIYSIDELANINQAVCLIRCKRDILSNRYLTHLLNCPQFLEILHSNEVNSARANLSLGFFSQLEVPCPSLPVQTKIADRLDEYRDEVIKLSNLQNAKLAALKELKQSLLQRAFAGELT